VEHPCEANRGGTREGKSNARTPTRGWGVEGTDKGETNKTERRDTATLPTKISRRKNEGYYLGRGKAATGGGSLGGHGVTGEREVVALVQWGILVRQRRGCEGLLELKVAKGEGGGGRRQDRGGVREGRTGVSSLLGSGGCVNEDAATM